MKTVKSDSTLSDYSSNTELTASTEDDLSIGGSIGTIDDNDNDGDDDNDSLASSAAADDVFVRGVSWGPVHVREYERIIADATPSVGVPIGLGWNSVQRPPVSIERWESDRIRRTNLKLSSITRKNMMHNVFGFSEKELREAEKENQKIRSSNLLSKLHGGSSSKTTGTTSDRTMAQRIGKKVKRASWTLLKGFSAASQSATVMSSSMGHAY
jgi:hypothetical protein